MKILKAISFTVVFIVFFASLLNLQVYCQETGITDSSKEDLPIPIGGPDKEVRKGIKEIKVNTENEQDVLYWDENGNILERIYTKCYNNKCSKQIINYDPKRTAVIDGTEFIVQDARGALFFTLGESVFGNTYYKPDERVIILEDKNIIAEYSRDRRVSNNITQVIIYDKGRQVEVFILGEKPDESLRRKTDEDLPITYVPRNTKLKEILKK